MAATLFLNNSHDLDLLLGFLHLPPKSIEISKKKRHGSQGVSGPAFQQGEAVVSGIFTVARQLVKFASNLSPEAKVLNVSNVLENSQIQQWLLYCETHLKPSLNDLQEMQHRAEELDDHFCSQTFAVGNHISLADLFIFQAIHPYMTTMSFLEKEKYIHISRWFKNVQHSLKAGQKFSHVPFHRTELYSK